MTEAEPSPSRSGQHVRSLIEDHFRLRISPEEEQRLRAHLPTCAPCRHHYNKHLMVADLDPKGAPAFDRLAVGLGVRAHRPRPAALYMGSLAAVAAGLLLVLIVLPDRDTQPNAVAHENAAARQSADDDEDPARHGLVARGAEAQAPADIFVHRVRGSDITALADGDAITADDELAFAYRNPAGRKHMLVFAVDGQGSVHWYYPAWHDAATTPSAMPIENAAEPRRLADAIRHPLRGTHAQIFAIFTDQSLTVRAIESWLANPGPARAKLEESLRTDPDAVVRVRMLRLQP